MIIDYKFKNFRSFRRETDMSFKAGKQRTFNENLIAKDGLRILPSAVIYGANASGKSNVIMSLSVMENIVTYGSLSKLPQQISSLEIYPFIHSEENSPMEFDITFENEGHYFQYMFAVMVDRFRKGKQRIVKEVLKKKIGSSYIEIFHRNKNDVNINKTNKILKLIGFEELFLDAMLEKLKKSLDKDDLFLCNGFKSAISSELADLVIDFFKNKLLVVSDFTLKKANLTFSSEEMPEKDFFAWNRVLDGFVRETDFGPQNIVFKSRKGDDDQSADMQLVSIYECEGKEVILPAEWMESRGTLKLIDFAIPFQQIFSEGGVLVLDEFDAAIHPEIVKGIIALFHDTSVNTRGAQIVFSTHNPIYLNNKIYRRDQILFVEKDKEEYESTLYSLADFGSTDVRNDENYLVNYFKGKYSILPYIDFGKIIKGEN